MMILGVFVLALVVRSGQPTQPPPTVIYVQPEQAASGGLGCLPFVVLSVVLLFILLLLER
jgi:hypothetical protein